jgi:hypothetical protein
MENTISSRPFGIWIFSQDFSVGWTVALWLRNIIIEENKVQKRFAMAQNPSEQPQNPPEPSPNPPPPVPFTVSPKPPGYPANLTVDYPDRDLNRLTTFFRIFVAIPILIIIALLSGPNTYRWQSDRGTWESLSSSSQHCFSSFSVENIRNGGSIGTLS